jgi:hypothetical protein
MPDKIGRKLISDMKASALQKGGLQTTSGRAQMRATESQARNQSKAAASRYNRANTAAKAAKAAKVAKLARVTPVGIVSGVALEKGSEYARKKFVEADTRKVAKLKREASNIDKAMAAARKKNKGY